MINLRVLVPEATTNYVLTPSPRYDTTGWNTQGATLTRSLDYSRYSIASFKVVTAGVAINEGIYYRVSSLVGISEPITVSIHLRGTGKVRLRLDDNVVGGGEFISAVKELTPDRWITVEVTGFSTGGSDMRLWVESADVVPRAYTFYADGAQMERKPYATSYCDGSQPGCRWNVVSYGSTSTRTADTRLGGRWVALAGPCRPDNDIYVTVLDGLGAAPVRNNIQPWAQVPGSYYQNQKILDRVVNLKFTVKDENIPSIPPASLRNLHNLRQQLVDLFKNDVTLSNEPITFEYSDTEADRPLYMKFYYEGGLEGSWDVRNGYFNSFVIRLLAVDPLWKEDNQNVKQIGINSSSAITVGKFFVRKRNKVSFLFNTEVSEVQQRFLEGPDGYIYYRGASKIKRYDGSTESTFVTANSGITDFAIAPDGTMYVIGSFTTIDGVAATRVAKRNPTTGVWSAMGTGLNADAVCICVAQNGEVYVGGAFTTAGGISCLGIAAWDGLQWRTVGSTSGVSGSVNVIIKDRNSNDTLYIGGAFLTSNGGGVTYNCVARVDITTRLIHAMGYGFSGNTPSEPATVVRAMEVGLDGSVYAGGNFTASGSPGTGALSCIAKYIGSNEWSPVENGLNDTVRTLKIDKNGVLFIGGFFDSSGSKKITTLADFSNNVISSKEIYIAGVNTILSEIMFTKSGDMLFYVYPQTAGQTIQFPSYTTINNEGSAAVYPRMYIKGSGTVRFIGNVKTGQGIYLNLPIFSNEEVFIDFALGKIESTVRGSLIYNILPGSEIRSINLLPEDNEIGVLITNDVNSVAQISYQPQHWSADAVMNAPAMV